MTNLVKRRSQAERVEASDRAVYQAAIALIASEGTSSLTIARVGKLAGYTGGVVVHRFKNKSGLLKAVATRILDLWDRRMSQAVLEQDSALATIKLFSDIYLGNIRSKNDLIVAQYRLMQESHSSCKEILPFFRNYDKSVRRRISRIIEAGQASGEFKKSVNPEAFALTYIGMLRGVAIQFFINQSGVDIDLAQVSVEDYCESLIK